MRHVISATELAKMGKCERQLYYDAVYGENAGITARFIERGNREHLQFNDQLTGRNRSWLVRFLYWLLRLLRLVQ